MHRDHIVANEGGYFLSKTFLVVGLQIHNTMFSDGESVFFCIGRDEVKVQNCGFGSVKYKTIGYLCHDHAKRMIKIDNMFRDTTGAQLIVTEGTILGKGNGKEVFVEVDFHYKNEYDKTLIDTVTEILAGIKGRIIRQFIWEKEIERN